MPKSNQKLLSGTEAAAEAMRQINPGVAAMYPITPSTPIMEIFAQYVADGKVDTEFLAVESEHSAMSAMIGAAAAGVRTMTATSANGLAYMFEVVYIAAGLRLPMVMNLGTRAIGGPINIHGDFSDAYSVRDSGWLQLFASTPQEVYDLNFISLKLAENDKIQLPVMVCQDGFRLTHSTEPMSLVSDQKIEQFIAQYNVHHRLFDFRNPITMGPLSLPDSFTEIKSGQHQAYQRVFPVFNQLVKKYKEISQRTVPIVETYKINDADRIIVVLGAIAGTIKDVIDELRLKEQNVGLVRPIFYRPFPKQQLAKALSSARKIAVLDQASSLGAAGSPLYLDVVEALRNNKQAKVANYIAGLGGRDISKEDIHYIFQDLKSVKRAEVRFIQ